MKNILFTLVFLVLSKFNTYSQTVTDYDGNTYNTVTIGTQIWLKENLKVTHFQNGDPINNITDSIQWAKYNTSSRCYYKNDSAKYASVYGALYNWLTAQDTRNICPTGWHLPTRSDWNILSYFLDNTVDTLTSGQGGQTVGGDLKEAGLTHWNSPNSGATNSSGFTGLPGGVRTYLGSFL
ncbi:MAG: fibrobacter succinogenes major paralogous domain-containing protein, partial [Bacteroidetes bacterium]|nr:fibrobacter succinogenes major paralogous domain-containing protein [Bacteroidota bacterium]